ncbi:hypothetical protein E2C01_096409 [Portunus trituberculatus]|uniref:Uncharacterized protein n=1 Tax=Portunus trituberculatus TaxID=210409 RepID=A0A5B7K2P9_PORTR|nr:hypothetical protein [Portunus trituberculatus]
MPWRDEVKEYNAVNQEHPTQAQPRPPRRPGTEIPEEKKLELEEEEDENEDGGGRYVEENLKGRIDGVWEGEEG